MKRIGTIASMLVLAGSLAGSVMAADGILLKEQAGENGENYCHMKFSAMDENTLSSDHPRLKLSDTGDFIDFYGPCDESPTGKDQVEEQRQQESNKWSTDYEG
jgi:hypothetical protein